ncbi:hypothetical protein [Deinococcus roseus]|uniref:Lipoprotein n=1 Tax=Deinococcus roseus TaxID=392414 RepID=A0ABQ2CXP5_9DEIO|nr:hypothetical protein [Deinococcus roseus]GGJ19905.1 hypothetical protein GCM10008938_02610 [Deinococcus roseus]
MLRNFVLMALVVGLASCAPGATSSLNQSKNPYSAAARYETLSSIKVKPGETTYATVSYNPKYLDGDFSKAVENNVVEPDYPKEGDIYAGSLQGMFDVMSISPKKDVDISIAYVEARREIGKVTVTPGNYYDNIQYKYYDSIEVTYKIIVAKSEEYIPSMYTLDLRNNFNSQHKSVMLFLKIEGQDISSLLDDILKDDDGPETPAPSKPEEPKSGSETK